MTPDRVQGRLWIRNPWWDTTWILSGMPIGLLLLCLLLLMPAATIALSLIMVLDTGHLLSPMILAWSHDDFRPLMLQQSIKYIVIPGTILLGTTALGIAASVIFTDFHPHIGLSLSVGVDHAKDYLNPFVMMLVAYGVWNAYRFAKQDFGVLSIYRAKAGCHDTVQRRVDLIFHNYRGRNLFGLCSTFAPLAWIRAGHLWCDSCSRHPLHAMEGETCRDILPAKDIVHLYDGFGLDPDILPRHVGLCDHRR